MAESMKYRLTLPPGAMAPINVIRINGNETKISNTILSRNGDNLVIAGELSAKTRGLLAEAGVQIEQLNGCNGTQRDAAYKPPTIDEMFATLGHEPEGPIKLDPNDVFARHMGSDS